MDVEIEKWSGFSGYGTDCHGEHRMLQHVTAICGVERMPVGHALSCVAREEEK